MVAPSDRRVTIRDIARRARVSHQTVSNVLNAPERVAPETARRVRAAIAALDYRPSSPARALAAHHSGLIGFRVGGGLVEEPNNLDMYLRELVTAGERRGYRIVLVRSALTDEAEVAALEDLYRSGAVDGAVLARSHFGDRRPGQLTQMQLPFVVFGRPWGQMDSAHAWVDVDDWAGFAQVVDHLVDRGHRRIGFLGQQPDRGLADCRRRGWRNRMKHHGLSTERLECLLPARCPFEQQIEAAGELISRRVSAIVAVHDQMAYAALAAARVHGIEVGRQLAVTGFDDSAFSRLATPPLTTLAQPLAQIAAATIDLLIAAMNGEPRAARVRLFTPELIVRASSDFTRSRDLGTKGT